MTRHGPVLWSWLGDHLTVDFANTVRAVNERREELVPTASDLATWLSAHVVASVCGVSVLVSRWPWTITVIQALGAVYLVWLGLRLRGQAPGTTAVARARGERPCKGSGRTCSTPKRSCS